MENEKNRLPVFSHPEPVIAVTDIDETISYWQSTLGFPSKWTWGDPPNHGGVSRQKVFIQFTLNPALYQQFGFAPAFSMIRYVLRDEDE